MDLMTNLKVLNGLSECRDKLEAKLFLKANGVEISDEELDSLQENYYTKGEDKTSLSSKDLHKVAGGSGSTKAAECQMNRFMGTKHRADGYIDPEALFGRPNLNVFRGKTEEYRRMIKEACPSGEVPEDMRDAYNAKITSDALTAVSDMAGTMQAQGRYNRQAIINFLTEFNMIVQYLQTAKMQ